jgi:ribosomal protein S4
MAKSDHKRHSAKHKIDRRLGVNLWGRPKSPLNSREYGPGQHGQRRKKPTDFGVQLMAKQKLKGYYGNIGEKQFKKYYQKATRLKGRYRPEPCWYPGNAPRCGPVSLEDGADRVRGASDYQSRPCAAEWQALQHCVSSVASG